MNPQKTYYNLKQIVNTSTTLRNYAAKENLKKIEMINTTRIARTSKDASPTCSNY
ncbi:hypothetical protein GIB67_025334 [Kingdonia uniflora]|uniref:Uncharacterized protein n=1 Tax=Kingdonia uniflora TaxID=39325 RepID=A0A7J7NCD2_9MAGN|nr:hypothetical protein GIB67_025334 [Kingdonia uniflora]